MLNRIEQIKQMIASGDQDPFLMYALAKEYEKVSPEKAIEAFEDLKTKHPQYVGLYYHLGKCYEKAGNVSLAREVYELGAAEANKQADFHSLSELNSALMGLDEWRLPLILLDF